MFQSGNMISWSMSFGREKISDGKDLHEIISDFAAAAIRQMQPFSELIQEAVQMYQDRSKQEADLIYYVAKMHDEDRTALMLAYDLIYKTED